MSRSSRSKKGGRKGWTSPEQFDWLQAQIPRYISLRTDGQRRLGSFWLQVYDNWFSRWPEEHASEREPRKEVRIVVQSGPELIVRYSASDSGLTTTLAGWAVPRFHRNH
jgi:hypothetical protein